MIYTSYYGKNSTAVVHSGVSYEATLFCCMEDLEYGGGFSVKVLDCRRTV